MGNFWSKSDELAERGDLIEITRGIFKHWAVYVGGGYVVHLTSPPGVAEVSGAASSSLMSVPTEMAMVRKQKLQEVVGHNEWKINNSLDNKYKPRSPDTIVNDALGQVDKRMEYCALRKNCEHFATKLRYGVAVSIQVLEAEPVLLTAVVAVGAFVVVGLAFFFNIFR